MAVETKPVARIRTGNLILIIFLGIFSFVLWGYYSRMVNGYFGFPLDDGWIHQVYARNLAEYGNWSYIPGHISGGSTSPLWTLMLSALRMLGFGPFGSAGILGLIFFSGTLVISELWARRAENYPSRIPLTAILLALEWHLVWSALSGMETVLFIFFIVLFFLYLSKKNPRTFVVGILVGITIWIRPDGITLIGPALVTGFFRGKNLEERVSTIAKIMVGLLCLFIPYLLFNRIVAGEWMPNTFYAKQTEYVVLLQQPFLQRFGRLFLQPLIGVGLFFLPGFIQQVVESIDKKNWVKITAVLWFLGFILIYVLRLPVTYQHGRYLMPAMPVFFIIGFQGSIELSKRGIHGKSWHRILSTTGILSACLILLFFWVKGAQAYQADSAVIHEEMVIPSLWVRDHTEEGAVVAAHDIGALGYYGQREIFDLAGLISPEVIPYIRDEDELLAILQSKDIDYLMTFPDWYSELPDYGDIVYQSDGKMAVLLGNSNMTIYQFKFK